jgi:hypothetical protein
MTQKKIPTYSWLLKKAMAMLKKDPLEYMKLVDSEGSNQVLRGFNVHFSMNPHSQHDRAFYLRTPVKTGRSTPYAAIHCNTRKGKRYSVWSLMFATTQYKKRLTDKYLPITLPNGVKSYFNDKGHETKCIYHNADGSVAFEGQYFGGRRGRSGHTDQYLVLCDETGRMLSREEIVKMDVGRRDEDAQLTTGFFAAASHKRSEWLGSIKQLSDAGLVDGKKMLTVAAKTYLAASRFCERYPKVKLALFPAGCAGYTLVNTARVGEKIDELQAYRYRSDHTPVLVLGRNASHFPDMWHMPEVLMYWKETDAGNHGRAQWSYISMTIPPHGNDLLRPAPDRVAPLARNYRLPNQIPFRDIPNGRTQYDCLECAYHQLLAFHDDTPSADLSMPSRYWETVMCGFKHQYYAQEQRLVNWSRHTDKVHMRYTTDLYDEKAMPFKEHAALAIKPDDVILALEERFLLESLPVC